MSRLFLVRLHSRYRWHRCNGEMQRDAPLYVYAFRTRDEAESFVRLWSPPVYNPFREMALNKRQFYFDLAPGGQSTISESDLREEVILLGLTPPLSVARKKDQPMISDWQMWVSWWESQATEWEDLTKATLWRLVNPNAIEILEVELERAR